MKKALKILMLIISILLVSTSVFASNEIQVKLNGEYLDFTDENGQKVVPQIINDRTMVPMRKIFEVLGATVTWDGNTRTVTGVKDNVTITLQINNLVATKNANGVKEKITLDSAPTIVDGRTLVPIRFIAESLEKDVDWDAENRIVVIEDISIEVEVNKIKKIDESKELVYSSYSKASSYYSWSIPYINIDSAEVKKINAEIEADLKPIVEGQMKIESEIGEVLVRDIKYYSYINDNILSVITFWESPIDENFYKVYNLDVYSGTLVTNTDIINKKNMTESEFLAKLEELYRNKFYSVNYISNLSEVLNELEQEQLNKTISSDNYSIETPMFLNENGKISLIATIYSRAGADSYDHILDTDI